MESRNPLGDKALLTIQRIAIKSNAPFHKRRRSIDPSPSFSSSLNAFPHDSKPDNICRTTPLIYVKYSINYHVEEKEKPIVWLKGEIKTPPFSQNARVEAGTLLRRLQYGENIGLPHSRPMPSIGKGCHELRITDQNLTWRIVYKLHSNAVIIGEVFSKKTQQTPKKSSRPAKRGSKNLRTISNEYRRTKETRGGWMESGIGC